MAIKVTELYLRLAQFHATRSSASYLGTVCGNADAKRRTGWFGAVVSPLYTETRGYSGRRGNLEFAAEAADSSAEHCRIGFPNGCAEYLAAKPVGIILVGGVTAEINYVRDEIPGLRAVTIENGSSPISKINYRGLGLESSRFTRFPSMIIRLED